MRRSAKFVPVLVVACLCAGGVAAAFADVVADSADDVCAPGVDPCNVTQRVELVAGSVLDFGLRTLALSGSGELDFVDRKASVLAGPIVLGGNGVRAASSGVGAVVKIRSRRGCSVSPLRACLSDRECDLGACGSASKCARDASVACANNADCLLGSCSVGSGRLAVDATVDGAAASPGSVTMSAAGELVVNAVIDVSGTGVLADGGSVELESYSGSLTVTAPIKAAGGGEAFGGTVSLWAGGDIASRAAVDASGGDSDGGSVTMRAGRDLLVVADINASSVAGAGYGGEIDLSAARDLSVVGASFNSPTSLLASGHKNDEFPISAGDGGEIALYAARDLRIGRYAYVHSRGAAPEGYGGDVDLSADGAVSMAGLLRANADGNDGDGGSIAISAGVALETTDTAAIEVDGGNGGYIIVTSDSALRLGGAFSLGARVNGGIAGSLSMTSAGDAVVTASITALKQSGSVELEACRLTLESVATITNNTLSGVNRLVSRESMKLLAGSSVTTKTSGTNTLVYRTSAKPPLRQGTITPAPDLQLDPTLAGCPVCGNAEVDESETCDDGNTVGGDGCSSDCQLDSCIAQTTGGYPANPLCFDASDCTVDTCDTNTGNCRHVVECGDGVSCTIDSCSGTVCTHTANSAACSDGNFCNGTEICHVQTGCNAGPVPDCDDAVACTVDSCSIAAGQCANTPNAALCSDGSFCNGEERCSATAGCLSGIARDCDDAVVCTNDSCDEDADTCVHATDDAACQDDDECTTNSCDVSDGCIEEPSGLPGCTTTTTTLPAVLCGDANGNGMIQASDALLALRAAVGSSQCDLAACDVNDSGKVTASDALSILKAAVGQAVELHCPPPGASSALLPEVPATSTTTTTREPLDDSASGHAESAQ